MTPLPITPRGFRRVDGEHKELLAANGLEPRYPEVDRVLTEEEMVDLVTGCRAVIVGVDPVTDPVLAAGPLSLVVKYGAGLDNVDLDAAARRDVRVVPTPGTNAPSVAELTIGLMLALARGLVPHHQAMVDGSRSRRVGVELAGRRLGIIGYGHVGRRVAELARCLGMDVLVHDPLVEVEGYEQVGLDDIVDCDVVSIHAPQTEATHHLIDRGALAALRPDALLINTARPAIVDQTALADALDRGQLGGAAFDDLTEDPAISARLLASDRFIATPHCGATTNEAVVRTGAATVRAVLEHRSLWQG
jgi:D-3-phosphoglycerate dehydrogenase